MNTEKQHILFPASALIVPEKKDWQIIILDFPIALIPKQSTKFTRIKNKAGKYINIQYQPKAITNNQKNLKILAHKQLKEKYPGFRMFTEYCFIRELTIELIHNKTETKKNIQRIANNGFIFKNTIPDLDNFEKQFYDSMEGIIYNNDSIICLKDNISKQWTFRNNIHVIFEGK